MSTEQLLAFIKARPISVGCGLISFMLAVGIYLRSDGIPESEALLDQKASLGERLDANLKNGVQLPEQFAVISAARQQIEARMIHPDELAKNLQFFYKLEADTSTKLIDLRQNQFSAKVGAKTEFASYINVGFAVSVRGDYLHLLDFLKRLESRQRFCRVNSATIALLGSTDKDRAGELTLNLGLDLLGQP